LTEEILPRGTECNTPESGEGDGRQLTRRETAVSKSSGPGTGRPSKRVTNAKPKGMKHTPLASSCFAEDGREGECANLSQRKCGNLDVKNIPSAVPQEPEDCPDSLPNPVVIPTPGEKNASNEFSSRVNARYRPHEHKLCTAAVIPFADSYVDFKFYFPPPLNICDACKVCMPMSATFP
jgi:hypothetical protein